MSMRSKSVMYDGEVYWDCLEIDFESSSKTVPRRVRNPSSSGYSGSSSDNEDGLNDWQELAFEELGETPQVTGMGPQFGHFLYNFVKKYQTPKFLILLNKRLK